ncbi:MAG: DUF2259 domain-containing protein [Rhizobiales bacterium]|nr:DUF2259 domain-containing protein [Hyphomicrobiales bacterium]NRB13790.1 DUF2259 domain-containing protein [Hyphomicrobiales bacterium]
MFRIIRIIIIFVTLIMAQTIAQAGDAALKRIMGFSPDGVYFTFEQYGIQDGSGFPYSEIFFINAKNNTWVVGTEPIRVVLQDETASLAQARAVAIANATPTIKRLNTTLHGFTLVSNPITQLDTDKYNARFGIHPSAPTNNQYKIKLTTKNANSSKCNDFAPDAKIFELELTSLSAQYTFETYVDTNLPTSRGCPIDYSISDVHFFEAVNGDLVFMTFINVMRYGFEGPDRRFMVIPFYVSNQ